MFPSCKIAGGTHKSKGKALPSLHLALKMKFEDISGNPGDTGSQNFCRLEPFICLSKPTFTYNFWPDTVSTSGLNSCVAFQTLTMSLLCFMDVVHFLACRVISDEWPIGTKLHEKLGLLSNIACLKYLIKLSQIYRLANSHPSRDPGRF